jgi:predicted nucleic acid-binding protein
MNFIFPDYGLEEVYYYKDEIIRKSGMSEKEFDVLLLRLLKYIRLVPLGFIIDFKEEAIEIIEHIHKNDVVFIATALAFNCPVWSDDKHFKMQKKIKVFTTEDVGKLVK